jgi:hypothetical protein
MYKIKKVLLVIAVAGSLLIGIVPVVSAGPLEEAGQITIVGQNNPAVDVQAVQKAVDQGGTTNLKGTFDFGDKGRVNIIRDVKIIGETNHHGRPITKIKGGYWTFHSPLPSMLPPEVPGPRITIQNIYFDGALHVPILLSYCSGATVSNNKIRNIRPIAIDGQIFGKSGLNNQQGIICSPLFAQPLETRKYIPNAFTGNLIIEGNDIDLANDVPTKTIAQGVFVIGTIGINAQIQRNTIMNCSRNSIETIDNFLGKDGSGMVFINDNKMVTAAEGVPVPAPQTPTGMVVGWFLDKSGGLDPQRNIKHIVVNNAVRTRGKTSGGIAVFTNGAVVVNNGILSEGIEAFSLAVLSSEGYIAHNKMEGVSTTPAILVRPWQPLKGSKNVFVDNDLTQFKTSAADVIFEKDTHSNFFIGHSCKVSDLGSNNFIETTNK